MKKAEVKPSTPVASKLSVPQKQPKSDDKGGVAKAMGIRKMTNSMMYNKFFAPPILD